MGIFERKTKRKVESGFKIIGYVKKHERITTGGLYRIMKSNLLEYLVDHVPDDIDDLVDALFLILNIVANIFS